jgi:single-strand DNA-binding protein
MSARIAITGANIGRDAEGKQIGDHYIVEFPVAVNEKRRGEEKTSWFRCKAWGNFARSIESSLLKGARVSVEGRLVIDEWVDRDGNKRLTPEVSCDSVHVEMLADHKQHRETEHERQKKNGYQRDTGPRDGDEFKDEIPF